MKATERVAKFFGIISVKERGNLVKISGIDGLVMSRFIAKIFETQIINKQMFTSITDTSLTIHQFFIPDLVFMLSKIRMDPKCGWSGRRTIDKIVEGIMRNTWFKVTLEDKPPMIDPKRMDLLKWKPMPKQLEFLHAYGVLMAKYDLRGYLLAFAAGGGKATHVDSLILTPSGWVRMGDLKEGDFVSTPDGGCAPVTGIYPQGVIELYRVILSDGRCAECSLDHLWSITTDSMTEPFITTTGDIIENHLTAKIPVYDPTTSTVTYKRIQSIKSSGSHEAQCITVNHPDQLYITNDYIVTHNTFTDLLVATCVIPPSIAEVKIIISPKKAIHLVWEKSIQLVFKKIPKYWVCDSGIEMPKEKCEYYIFNYEKLDKAYELAQHLITRGIRYFVIVDESHNFADPTSGRTKQLVKLQTLKDNLYFIWTSGTPILKKGSELVSFLRCADPRFDDDAERRFKRIFTTSPGRAFEIFNHRLGQQMAFLVPKTEFTDVKPIVKELPVRLPPSVANRFLMETVRADMKEFIKERIKFYAANIKEHRAITDKWLEFHGKTLKTRAEKLQFEDYKKTISVIARNPDLMLTELMAKAKDYERTKLYPTMPPESRKEFRSALSAYKNIKLKVRGEALGTVLSKRRSECAAALGVYCKPEVIMKESLSKTMFFASSVLPITVMETYLKKKGFKPVMVYGSSGENLTKQINDFTDIPDLNPICATMQSLSEAVPVTAASTVVFLNRPWRPAMRIQVIARADRISQQFPVTVIDIVLDTGDQPNVSSTTDEILRSVTKYISELVGSEFAGDNPDDREVQAIIDASEEYPHLMKLDDAIIG
jgi:hypothetical protein